MKTFIKIVALCLALIFSLSMLVSCGKSMDKIVDKIKDLDEDDYMYYKSSKSERKEIASEMEEEIDFELDGDVDALYNIYGDGGYCTVVEFEKTSDAKGFVKAFKEYIDDCDEDDLGYDPDDLIIERSGNIVIFATDEDIVDEIW